MVVDPDAESRFGQAQSEQRSPFAFSTLNPRTLKASAWQALNARHSTPHCEERLKRAATVAPKRLRELSVGIDDWTSMPRC